MNILFSILKLLFSIFEYKIVDMALLDKVLSNVHACGIELAFVGDTIPSNVDDWQPFYNSLLVATDFQKAYASVSSIEFNEEGISTTAGPSYKQKLVWRFPEADSKRAERIALIHKIKFVKFKFTNQKDLIFGRNDINQNSFPNIKTTSNGRLCQVEIETQSIFPSGYSPIGDIIGLPVFIPLIF